MMNVIVLSKREPNIIDVEYCVKLRNIWMNTLGKIMVSLIIILDVTYMTAEAGAIIQ